jgi:hypothetical protein
LSAIVDTCCKTFGRKEEGKDKEETPMELVTTATITPLFSYSPLNAQWLV